MFILQLVAFFAVIASGEGFVALALVFLVIHLLGLVGLGSFVWGEKANNLVFWRGFFCIYSVMFVALLFLEIEPNIKLVMSWETLITFIIFYPQIFALFKYANFDGVAYNKNSKNGRLRRHLN